METKDPTIKNFNLVGIVPTAGQKLDFDFPWHDSLQPIGKNYLAVEKAVFDCAMAGCNTIWVVCNKEMQPLIRYRLGDYIVDPYRFFMSAKYESIPRLTEIPIYYVPVHPKDIDRRDSLAWSIITGAQSAYWVARKLSKWITPNRYFVAFPYGVFNTFYLKDYRKYIRKPQPFYVSYKRKNFKDNLYLPFTFDAEDFLLCRSKFRERETGGYDASRQRVKAADAYSGRDFTHGFVFDQVKTKGAPVLKIPWYYDVSSWEGLKKWLSCDFSLVKPREIVLSYHEWNPIGVDNEEE
jgi:hypothetical protein